MRILSSTVVLFFCVVSLSCVEGETDDLAELVWAEKIGLVSISLEKEHDDKISPGNEINISAIGTLDSGDTTDITHRINWQIDDSALSLENSGAGLFEGQALQDGQVNVSVTVNAEVAGFQASEQVVVSTAALISLKVGILESNDTVSTSGVGMPACSELSLYAEGTYESDSVSLVADIRNETENVIWSAVNGVIDEAGVFSNVSADISGTSGTAVSVASASASLSSITSNSFGIAFPDALSALTVSSEDEEEDIALVMEQALAFTAVADNATASDVDVSSLVVWTSPSLVSTPEAQGSIGSSGVLTAGLPNAGELIADVGEDDVYGVEVIATCSGFVSAGFEVEIVSDISTIDLTDVAVTNLDGNSGDENALLVNDVVRVIAKFTGVDGNLDATDITDNDIEWSLEDNDEDYDIAAFTTPLIACDDGEPLCAQFTVDGVSTLEDIDFTVTAIYHGVKGVTGNDLDPFTIEQQ